MFRTITLPWHRTTSGSAVSDEDAALVARASGGDPRAFEELMRRHADAMLNLARRVVIDVDAAQDVVQDAFISAYRQLPRFRGDAAFSTWIYRITLNSARVYLRSTQRRAKWEWTDDEMVALHAQTIDPTDDEGYITELMAHLPEKHRMAVALFYLQDLSLTDIAEIMDAPTGTVKAWLSRGRERLRALARQEGLL